MKVETILFKDDGETPNHPCFPVIFIRRSAAIAASDPAAWFEDQFASHGWGGTWRWTVYPFHHYHTTNHEVLGISRGEAKLKLGGQHGREFEVAAGDVIVIPAGVGHKRITSTDDFQVVGAYPGGDEPDLIRAGEGNINEARKRIAKVPAPKHDPIDTGTSLLSSWIQSKS